MSTNSNNSSNTQSTTLEALESKVKQAAATIKVVLDRFEEENDQAYITPEDYIWERLQDLGIYRDAESHEILLSTDCTEGEARRVFCENGEPNLPPVRFKRAWTILKGNVAPQNDFSDDAEVSMCTKEIRGMKVIETVKMAVSEIAKINRPIGQWSDEELVSKYEPDCEQEIIDTLDKRSKGKAFVIYDDEANNKVNIAATLSMLRQVRKGHNLVHYKVGSAIKRLYRAGHFACETSFECPLHPGVLLLVEDGVGYCDECGHAWKLEAYDNMQFARIVYEMGDAPEDKAYLRQFVNNCNTGTLEQLGQDYPKALLKFEERKADDTLPRLKRRSSIDNRGPSDPMNVKANRTF